MPDFTTNWYLLGILKRYQEGAEISPKDRIYVEYLASIRLMEINGDEAKASKIGLKILQSKSPFSFAFHV